MKHPPQSALPQVNNTVVFSIGPGVYAQKLHRDDPVHHNFHLAASTHSLGRDSRRDYSSQEPNQNTTKRRHEIYSRLPSMGLLPSPTSER